MLSQSAAWAVTGSGLDLKGQLFFVVSFLFFFFSYDFCDLPVLACEVNLVSKFKMSGSSNLPGWLKGSLMNRPFLQAVC
jgi:hypothetical protein